MAAGLVTEELLKKVTDFHGHLCPGLAIGIRAAEIALREVGPHARDEEVVAVVETDMCGVDAIQYLTGCTYGKGNLIHRDYGKNAFSFYRRSDGKGVRIVTVPQVLGPSDPEREQLLARMREGTLSPAEERRFAEMQKALSEKILQAPLDTLFTINQPPADIPRRARIHGSQICDACGEAVMAIRIRQQGERTLCIPCFEKLAEA
jgi:formylmethanofuran dehydrogenase subunit E